MSKYTVSTYTITGFGVDLTAFGKHHISRPFIALINHFEDLADSSVTGDICWDDQIPFVDVYAVRPDDMLVSDLGYDGQLIATKHQFMVSITK